MILAAAPGTEGVIARAWRHLLRAVDPADPALREFADYWLGRGADACGCSHNRRPMAAPLRLALAQIDATVGDIAGNAAQIRERIERARATPAPSSSCSPSWRVTGYPPEDLLLKEHFLARRARRRSSGWPPRPTASSRSSASPSAPRTSTTPLAVLADGEVQAIYRKAYLPNYGVFDEQRYFQAGHAAAR